VWLPEELITELVRLAEFLIIARKFVFTYKGSPSSWIK
jgi:TolB-like protein